ncbi:hypothetical protein ABBQ38_006742 [Trebouxia sp. C0009 RCD-2024]
MSDAPDTVRVGLVSDTHAVYDKELDTVLENVQHILHAGDIGHKHSNPDDVLSRLSRIAPTLAVRGNVDNNASHIPEFRLLHFGGWKVLLLHIAGMPPTTTAACLELVHLHHPDTVIFGHSHKHGVCQHNGVMYINPGSAGPARFKLARSAAILSLPVKTPTAQLSDDMVQFCMLATKGYKNIAAKDSHSSCKRRRKE